MMHLPDMMVDTLFADLNDRQGLHIDSLSEEQQQEIRRVWLAIIRRCIKDAGEGTDTDPTDRMLACRKER